MKMTHEEVGICRRYVTKKYGFKDKLRCDALDIQIRNLVHKRDLCTMQKNNKGILCIDSKKTSLTGHFLWDMRRLWLLRSQNSASTKRGGRDGKRVEVEDGSSNLSSEEDN